ncbi:30S ribosomal protein S4e [Candidatus Bathyarchaeota archaeon]|nr:30S ribosomal protein S4e [Candidatus Bathyarchaeota archaeon]
MGRKGAKRHMKREVSPVFWPIHRKEKVWAIRPSPGPHGIAESFPLLVILRDLLGYAETRREAKIIIKEGKVKVDGRVRYDERFPVGLMDVVEIPDVEQYFRVLPSKKGLTLHPISREESRFKLCKIVSKTTVKGGHIQLNLHDGRNLLIRVEDPLHPVEDVYRVHDVLKIGLPGQELEDHLRFEEKALALVTGGKSRGKYGQILGVERHPGLPTMVTLRTPEGEEVRTIIDYVFPVGVDSPIISLPRRA